MGDRSVLPGRLVPTVLTTGSKSELSWGEWGGITGFLGEVATRFIVVLFKEFNNGNGF